MYKEIGRKITSLTLLSILLASGVTFAVPGALPAAEASHNANLFVSSENSQFSNYFAGPQVIEVVVNDPNISDTDEGKGEPDVTVNSKKLRMVQASDGSWYGYFADRLQAQTADQTVVDSGDDGFGLDFGSFCAATGTDLSDGTGPALLVTQTVGVAVPDTDDGTDGTLAITTACGTGFDGDFDENVVRESKTPTNEAGTVTRGQINVNLDAWPFIQLYDLSVGGNVIVTYNKAGGAQTTTLTFDTIPGNLINTSLDRSTYPQGAAVHVTLTDPQLNIDPTDEDSWTWDTSTTTRMFYQAFDEDGTEDANDSPGMADIVPSLSALMFEKNGRLTVDLDAQDALVAEFGNNNDQSTDPIDAAGDPFALSGMTFTELSKNGGVFGNYDEADDSNLDILDGAARGKSATIRYNDVSKSVVVGFGFGSIDINAPDGEWNSGEEIPVSLVDSDANKNSRADEDLDLFDPNVALIPSLKIGTPFTLTDGNNAAFVNGISLDADDQSPIIEAVGIAVDSDTLTVQPFSFRGIYDTTTAAILGLDSSELGGGAIDLGTASTFGVLAASTITNTGATVITGDLGLYPGTAITGFFGTDEDDGPGIVSGSIQQTTGAALQAQLDALAAFTAINSISCTTIANDLGGVTLTPGNYCVAAGFDIPVDELLTLDGAGTYTFKAGSTLVMNQGGNVTLINGATAENVFWTVGSSATLTRDTVGPVVATRFPGTVIAFSSITAGSGAGASTLTIPGRLLALNAAVTFPNPTIVTVPPLGTTSGFVIDLNRDIEDLQNSLLNTGVATTPDVRGINLFNYDIRSFATGATGSFTDIDIYLIINRTGTIVTRDTPFVIGPTATTGEFVDIAASTPGLVLASLGNRTSLQGLINLNATDAEDDDSDEIMSVIFSALNDKDDDIALLFLFDQAADVTIGTDDKPLVTDFFSVGIIGDGFKQSERVNNAIYRFELEETGDNTSTFIGTAEFIMLNQLNIFDDSVYTGLKTIDDEVTLVIHDDSDDEDSPRINYADLGQDGGVTFISDQQAAGTHSGVVSLDKDTYKLGDTVTVTLEDQDLNVDSDLIDIYVTVPAEELDPASDTVGEADLGTYSNTDSFGRLMDITFDDGRWVQGGLATTGANACTDVSATLDDGLDDSGFSLIETGTATGVFKGDFLLPGDYCNVAATPDTRSSVTGVDIEVNYVDFRDASGQVIEVGDGAGVRANTGSVSLDRTIYPVPFGKVTAFTDPGGSTPNGRSIFPVHTNGITAPIDAAETLGEGDLNLIIRVTDPDFDISFFGEDVINVNTTNTAAVGALENDRGPVKITVSRGSSEVVLGYAGGPTALVGPIDVGDDAPTFARQFGPMTEIAPDAGIFEIELSVLYTDGPASTSCPTTTTYTNIVGSTIDIVGARFDDTTTAPLNKYCILQGDIITVEYTDPTDASGDENSVTDSATFDLRNGVLQSDKSVYIIGSDMILTLIEPDLDLDSDTAETWDLDLIEWDSDALDLSMGDLDGSAAQFDPEPSDFRETGENTGIFQIVIEIPKELPAGGDLLDRGEEIQLEYTDWGPSGADFVGDEDEDINLTIYTSNFGATVELDQKVYTWTDKVFITIVAPDHNFDSNLIDEIGETTVDQVTIATRGENLKTYKLVETGTDTGIFTGEVILTGFCHDSDGNTATGAGSGAACPAGSDTNPRSTPANAGGPTNGFLQADDDDGLTVSFEFTEDETVVGSALVRWNIGEVQFLEASYPATGQGVVRVVDPDMNLNPEAVDNFEVDAWSDSDAGGIDLTVTETNEATGIFEGTVYFSVTDESSGHRLRVAEGDTVTGEYEDNTLPSPYTTADELEVTATTFIGTVVPPLERAPASNPRVVDAFGNELDEVSVDQQVQITADLANGQDRDQPFAYLVQISKGGVTHSLSWITGSLAPGQSLNPAQSWTPTESGTYDVQIFVWESVDNPDALSPPVETTVTVV